LFGNIADSGTSTRPACDSLCLGLAIGLSVGVVVVVALIILVIVAWRRGRFRGLRGLTSTNTAELPPHKTVIYVSAEDKESDRYCEIDNTGFTSEFNDVYLHPGSPTVFDEAL